MKAIVSVVTVCLNAEKTISSTIESVLAQDYQYFEYIVVDGNSQDKTFDIVKNYEARFAQRQIKYIVHQEDDEGVYDAMNKAISYCSGMYIEYMNADDTYHSSHVLSLFWGNISDYSYDVYYGDAMRFEGNEELLCHAKNISLLPKYMTFNHQAAFVKNETLSNYKFNNKYRIAADYDLFLRMFLDKKKFRYFPVVISNYSAEGLSNSNFYKTHLEYREIWDKNHVINKNHPKMLLKTCYQFIKGKLRPIKAFTPLFYYFEKRGGRL